MGSSQEQRKVGASGLNKSSVEAVPTVVRRPLDQDAREVYAKMRKELKFVKETPMNRYRGYCTLAGMASGMIMVISTWNAFKLSSPWGLILGCSSMMIFSCILAPWLAITMEKVRDPAYVPAGMHDDFMVGYGFYGPTIVFTVWLFFFFEG